MIFFKAIKIWRLREKKLREWKDVKRAKWLAEGRTPEGIERELKLSKVYFWKTYKKVKRYYESQNNS